MIADNDITTTPFCLLFCLLFYNCVRGLKTLTHDSNPTGEAIFARQDICTIHIFDTPEVVLLVEAFACEYLVKSWAPLAYFSVA